MIVAAPSYIERFGRPESPAELRDHRIIQGPAGGVGTAWTFARGGRSELAAVAKPSALFNDNEGAVSAAAAGMGVASIGYWSCRSELGDGRLVRLLSDWETVPTRVYAYFPLGKATRSAARAFIDFLVAKLNEEQQAPLST